MRRFSRLLAVFLFVAAMPALAAEPWLRLTSPNFELLTSAGEKKGRAAILHFEEVHDFFLKASPVRNLSDTPVRIIEFGSEEEYKRYTLNPAAIAFYMPGAARDFIVIDEPATPDFSVATHEYTHLIVRHAGLRIPVWLNEGWADVYSSLKPLKGEAAIGDLLPVRVAELNKDLWLDFKTLTTVATSSAIYNERERAGIFYAESWALAHMLYLSPEYTDNFGKFVSALNQGKNSDEAGQIAWGKSGEQVMDDLRSYFKRKKLTGRVYEIRLLKEQLEPVVAPLSDFDGRLALEELTAALGKSAEAKAVLERLEKDNPGRPEVARALGYLALQSQDLNGAREAFAAAFARGETDARMCLVLALLQRDVGHRLDLTIAALQRALKTRPGYTQAQIELGMAQLGMRDFGASVATLMAIPTVTPDRAPDVFCALAYGYLESGAIDSARTNLETCRKWSKAEGQVKRAEQVGVLVEARAKPAAGVRPGEKWQQVKGVAKDLVCAATAAPRLELLVGTQVVMVQMPEPAALEVTRTTGSAAELRCGPLTGFPVDVEYAPLPNGSLNGAEAGNPPALGIARLIVF